MNPDIQNSAESQRPPFNNLILHLHPPNVPERSLALTLTWGLGGMSLVLVVLLAMTGILLMLVYEPTASLAYRSIISIQKDIWFGQLIRNIHHWSGNILVIVSFLHLLRVFFTGAFHGSRGLNWVIGLCLFFLILISNFTGYLLPWDQLAFWAVTICTGMLEYLPGLGVWFQKLIRGGEQVGQATLAIFFTVHVVIVPLCLFLIMPFHFWRVRKAGGVILDRSAVVDSEGKETYVSTVPNLVMRELVVGLVLIAFVMVFSLIFDAPLETQANPGLSPNPTKAPWYFVGLQELFLHFHPLFAAWIIPVLIIGALIVLPYLRYETKNDGHWFNSPKGRRMGIVAAVTAFVLTPIIILGAEFLVDFTAWLPKIPDFVTNGLLPLTLILAGVAGFYVVVKKWFAASNSEATQSVFILLLVSFVILTIIGYWFRGPGMALVWP
jgi:quinol-cytochrome oxidoreductase complex cytochrome b subunit